MTTPRVGALRSTLSWTSQPAAGMACQVPPKADDALAVGLALGAVAENRYSGLPRRATWNLPSARLKTVSLPTMPLPFTTFVCRDFTVRGGQKPRHVRARALVALRVAREVVERHALLGLDDDLLADLGVVDRLDRGLVAATATAAVVASAASPVAMVGNAFMPTRTPERRRAFPAGCDASTHATRQHRLATSSATTTPTPRASAPGCSRGGFGAKLTGASVYDIPPGQALCPYHYEYGEEEWLIVLEGTASLRTPEGTEPMGPMELAFFPTGPEGAHLVRNDTDQPLRVLMFSNVRTPTRRPIRTATRSASGPASRTRTGCSSAPSTSATSTARRERRAARLVRGATAATCRGGGRRTPTRSSSRR